MEQAGDPMVIEKIHKSFADRKVLNGVTLRVCTGETVAGARASPILRYGLRLSGLRPSFSADYHEHQESKEKHEDNSRQYWILFP